jgi:hypothetical protein
LPNLVEANLLEVIKANLPEVNLLEDAEVQNLLELNLPEDHLLEDAEVLDTVREATNCRKKLNTPMPTTTDPTATNTLMRCLLGRSIANP